MQERVRELELEYQKYLRKRLFKGVFLGILCLGLGLGFYWGLEIYAHQKYLNAKLLEEKKHWQAKITEAKIEQEKMRLRQEKFKQEAQNSNPKEQNPPPPNPPKVLIKSSVFDTLSLKRSYYQSPSFEKALMLARLYLENKNYEKSIFWSLRANEWDKSAKESWLLFARARAALTRGGEAEILALYAHYYEGMELSQ